ncbi:MAG: cytochrome C, partial [Proteobacteria bacterium]|nr:cytochrome C [Pseudomonadota bacterium]
MKRASGFALAMLWARAAQGHTVPDRLAPRALACTGCHGKQGRAAPDG